METNPTTNATGSLLPVEASKLFVHPAVELRVERRAGRYGLGPPARPAPHEPADGDRADTERDERQDPREQVQALLRRLGEHCRPELGDELALDLALRVARLDAR